MYCGARVTSFNLFKLVERGQNQGDHVYVQI